VKYKLNIDSFEHVAATKLELNEIGVVNLELNQPIAYDPYAENRDTGGFILIDRITNNTVGAGMLHFALRRSQNVTWQNIEVDRAARAALKHQQPFVVWLTGIPGAGKSTIANLLERQLHAAGRHTYILDGDNLRRGLSKDLGFRDADRAENIRRAGEVSRLMVDAGLIVLAAFISPFAADRETVRGLFDEGDFVEVFVDATPELAADRDRKGLYAKAGRGELANLTGVDAPYERPEQPDVHLDMAELSVEAAAARVIGLLRERGLVA
jgi:bifunctional enzyme CysN/CysC